MRLPVPRLLNRVLPVSHDVARVNARQTLELMARRRREHEEVEAFLREPGRDFAREDIAR